MECSILQISSFKINLNYLSLKFCINFKWTEELNKEL